MTVANSTPASSAGFRTSSGWTLSLWSVVAAFGAYFCMYGFRKPYTAAVFADVAVWGIGYKTVLVTAQMLGYMLSKFIGIKVIAEMPPQRRAAGILVLVAIAEASLLLFGLIPPPYSLVCLFINGLPLGMVFGLVLGFLEGRRMTEALAAGLCASFILADGVAKSVGAMLLARGVSEPWMPFSAGLLFAGPLMLFVWMLSRIPPPDRDDVAHRSQRSPMTRTERWELFARHGGGLSLLIAAYLLITILRSIRADFAPEVWQGFGRNGEPGIFARSEVFVALGVMAVSGLSVYIRDNRRAFFAALGVSLAGVLIIAAALAALSGGMIEGFAFMVLVGLGLYLPYVAVHTSIFERLLAMTRDRGNIGFLLYVADAFGYLGYVAVMLGHGALTASGDFQSFFIATSWTIALASAVCLALCWRYFAVRTSPQTVPQAAPQPAGEG